jgi:Cof subfamily protein (haloacid dehalogenase superfamily)
MTGTGPPAIRLVCVDMDGTLIGASGVVDPMVWEAAARARAAGIRLAVCSGRPGFGVSRVLAAQVDPDGWHCFQNGASVLHLGSGRSLSVALAPETVAMLVGRARRANRPLELYTDDAYVTESTAERALRHATLLGLPFVPRPFESLPPPIVRAQWLLGHEEWEIVRTEPHPGLEVSPSLAPTMPDSVFVNLTRTGVDKGSAVRAIASAYDIELRDVMFVGDGYNDTPALRIVGWPTAMANAEPVARDLARRIVGHVDDGGVAEALELALETELERRARAAQPSGESSG